MVQRCPSALRQPQTGICIEDGVIGRERLFPARIGAAVTLQEHDANIALADRAIQPFAVVDHCAAPGLGIDQSRQGLAGRPKTAPCGLAPTATEGMACQAFAQKDFSVGLPRSG